MMLSILGFLLGIYAFARKVVKNEPLKSSLDSLFDNTNRKLSLYKNKKPWLLLENLLKLSERGTLYSFIACLIVFTFPKTIENVLFSLIAPIFLLCLVLNISISWVQKHNKTFKEFFFNFPMIGVLFSPLILYFFNLHFEFGINLSQIFYPFHSVISNVGIVYFQIIWLIGLILILYFGALIIAFPIYLVLYTLIIITGYFIRMIEKFNSHILDGIAGVFTVVIAFYNIFIQLVI